MPSPARLLRLGRRLLCTSPNPNPKPSAKPLRELIKPIMNQRDPDELVSLFNLSSSDPRFRAHTPIYSAAVLRLSAAGRPDAVESLIEHQKLHPEFSSSDAFAARLVLLYGRAGMPSHALSTFRSLPLPRSPRALNSLLSALAPSLPDPARFLLDLPSSFPDAAPTVVSYNIIISALLHRRDFDSALRVLQLMRDRGVPPSLVTHNTLLHGFYSNGRFDDGERIWAAMEERDVRSYNSRLRGLVAEKKIDDAVKVFDEMLERGVKPDIFSFNALIEGYVGSGMLEEAKRVYLGLEKHGCEPQVRTYRMLIPAAWEAKQYDFVVRLCNEGLNARCYLEVEMLQGIIDGLANEEMFAKAKKLIKHVRSKAFYADKRLRVPLPCLAI